MAAYYGAHVRVLEELRKTLRKTVTFPAKASKTVEDTNNPQKWFRRVKLL